MSNDLTFQVVVVTVAAGVPTGVRQLAAFDTFCDAKLYADKFAANGWLLLVVRGNVAHVATKRQESE